MINNEGRKLARVVLIDSLHEIAGADRIELAMIGGWQVIVQKGLYDVGSKAVYFEVDSLLPLENPAFESLGAMLSSKLQFEVDGKFYGRIKTMKMRGQISQGFCVPLSEICKDSSVDNDMTRLLGVLKYESVGEKQGNGANIPGTKTFPSFIPKTDQNRVQNISTQFNKARDAGELFEKSYKLDGSSMTVYYKDRYLGVASRNVGLRLQTEKKGFRTVFKDYIEKVKRLKNPFVKVDTQWKVDDNNFTKMAVQSGVTNALVLAGRNLAIQGELVGPSIQKNFEGVDELKFFIYDIYLIDEQRYMLPKERQEFCAKYKLSQVPLASAHAVTLPIDVATAILDADGPSGLFGKYREGFVYKSMDRDFSFKVVSNKYLMKEE